VGSESSDDSSTKWAGLRNIGNTCFMNSILQCLSCTKLLKEYVISRSYVKDIHQDGKLITAFSNLITKIWSQSSGTVDVSAFKDVFQRLAPQFAGYEQHDAQEFLRFLVDKLHTDVNRVRTKPKNLPELDDGLSDNLLAAEHWKRYLMSENSYILDLFCGQLKSTLECLVCGNKSVTFEIFWDVSLPLPAGYSSYNSTISIKDILNSFTQEEILDHREKPKCARCKIEQRMAKSYSFQKLPKYLVLHLKRFQTTSSYRKLSSVVQFPLNDLDMSPYLAKAAVSTPKRYNLYAVSNHVGTPFSGHYTANCKHPNCADWYTCNDSSVSKIAPPVMPKIVNAESYILFYEAVDN
jgi:ubiquitin carboxyl-terminal hydrolase 2/21